MDDSAAQRVAATVRAELARRRISQAALAHAVGLTQAGISRRLTGQVAFDVNELALVATALDVAMTDLLHAAAAVPVPPPQPVGAA